MSNPQMASFDLETELWRCYHCPDEDNMACNHVADFFRERHDTPFASYAGVGLLMFQKPWDQYPNPVIPRTFIGSTEDLTTWELGTFKLVVKEDRTDMRYVILRRMYDLDSPFPRRLPALVEQAFDQAEEVFNTAEYGHELHGYMTGIMMPSDQLYDARYHLLAFLTTAAASGFDVSYCRDPMHNHKLDKMVEARWLNHPAERRWRMVEAAFLLETGRCSQCLVGPGVDLRSLVPDSR